MTGPYRYKRPNIPTTQKYVDRLEANNTRLEDEAKTLRLDNADLQRKIDKLEKMIGHLSNTVEDYRLPGLSDKVEHHINIHGDEIRNNMSWDVGDLRDALVRMTAWNSVYLREIIKGMGQDANWEEIDFNADLKLSEQKISA